VLGLVLGNVAIGAAASAPTAGSTTAAGAGVRACLRLGAAVRDAGGRLVDVVAKLTGLPVATVAEKRAAGASFADIAKAKGVTADEIVAQALAVRKVELDNAVKAGKITQAQEDQMLARMKDRLTERVSATAQTRGCAGGGARGGQCGNAGQGGCGGAGGGQGGCGRGAGAGQGGYGMMGGGQGGAGMMGGAGF
jgi:uncharacterized protein (DUF433 family)